MIPLLDLVSVISSSPLHSPHTSAALFGAAYRLGSSIPGSAALVEQIFLYTKYLTSYYELS